MAKGNINLEIGTKFNGEGLQKLNTALKSTGGQVKKTASAVSQLSGQLGEMGGAAGKVVGGISNVVGSFMQMGMIGGVVAVGTLAIEGLFKWLNRTNEKLKELRDGFKDRLAAAIKATSAEISKLNEGFRKLLHAGGVQNTRRQIAEGGNLSRMELERKDATRGREGTDAAKVELEWTKKIEQEKTKNSKQRLADVQKEIELTKRNLAELQRQRKLKEGEYKWKLGFALDMVNSKADPVEKEKATQAWTTAKSQMLAFDKPMEELRKKLEELSTEQMRATEEYRTQLKREETAVADANQKVVDEMKKAAEAKEKAEKDRIKAERDRAKEEEKKRLDEGKKLLQEEKENVVKKAAQEEKDHAARMKAINEDIEKARKEALLWEQNAARDRGRSFKDVQKENRQREKDADRNAKREVDEVGKAIAERDKLGKMGFKRMTQGQRERFEELNRFIENQGGGVDEMTPERRRALEKMRDSLRGRIIGRDGKVRRGASQRDIDQWKGLEALFAENNQGKNLLKARQDELKKAEAERAERERKRTTALEDIQKRMKELGL